MNNTSVCVCFSPLWDIVYIIDLDSQTHLAIITPVLALQSSADLLFMLIPQYFLFHSSCSDTFKLWVRSCVYSVITLQWVFLLLQCKKPAGPSCLGHLSNFISCCSFSCSLHSRHSSLWLYCFSLRHPPTQGLCICCCFGLQGFSPIACTLISFKCLLKFLLRKAFTDYYNSISLSS